MYRYGLTQTLFENCNNNFILFQGNSEKLLERSVPTQKIPKTSMEKRKSVVKIKKERSQRLYKNISHTVEVMTSTDADVVEPDEEQIHESNSKSHQ